jgi:hypothetical protein
MRRPALEAEIRTIKPNPTRVSYTTQGLPSLKNGGLMKEMFYTAESN